MLSFTFIGLPLCYFYGETYDDFDEIPYQECMSHNIMQSVRNSITTELIPLLGNLQSRIKYVTGMGDTISIVSFIICLRYRYQ